jgi:hypothetical protein
MLQKHSSELNVKETIIATGIVSAASVIGLFGGMYVFAGIATLVDRIRGKKSKKS